MKKNILAALGALALLLVLAVPSFAVNKMNLKPDATRDSVCTVFGYPTLGVSCGKTTAATAVIDVVGDIYATGNVVSGGSTTGSNPIQVSSAIIGTGATKSTITAAGNAAFAGTLGVAGATALSGGLSVTGAISGTGNLIVAPNTVYTATVTAASGNIATPGSVTAGAGFVGALTGAASSNVLKAGDTMTGKLGFYIRNKANLQAITPAAAGEAYWCSDCNTTGTMAISTGTVIGSFGMMVWTQY